MRTWDGGGTGNNNWTNAANWAGNVVPVAGDNLVFAGSTQAASFNDFADDTLFDSITFQNGNFTLSGHAVVLDPQGGVAINNMAGYNSIALPFTLAPAATGATIVQAGSALELGVDAQATVLANGVDVQHSITSIGELVFDYSGTAAEASLLSSIRSDLHLSLFEDTIGGTLPSGANIGLGYMDNGSSFSVEPMLLGDLNHDGIVNTGDLTLMSGKWKLTGQGWGAGDLNYDGVVDTGDLTLMSGNWRQTWSPTLPSDVISMGISSRVTAVPGPGSTPVSPSGAVTFSVADAQIGAAALAVFKSVGQAADVTSTPAKVGQPIAADQNAGRSLSGVTLGSVLEPNVPAAVAKTGSVAALDVARQAALHDACFSQPAVAMPASSVRITTTEDALLGTPSPAWLVPEATVPADLVLRLAATLPGTSAAAETAVPDICFAAFGVSSSASDATAAVGDVDLGALHDVGDGEF